MISHTKKKIIRIITNTLIAIKQNRKWTIILTLTFSLIFLFATGAINRYLYIPDWYPYIPTIFTPANENFEIYSLIWRFSDRWLLSMGIEHITNFIILTILFAANAALLLNSWKAKKSFIKETTTIASGSFISLFALSTCCAPALAIALFGAGIVFALEPYSELIVTLAIILLTLNIILLNKKREK